MPSILGCSNRLIGYFIDKYITCCSPSVLNAQWWMSTMRAVHIYLASYASTIKIKQNCLHMKQRSTSARTLARPHPFPKDGERESWEAIEMPPKKNTKQLHTNKQKKNAKKEIKTKSKFKWVWSENVIKISTKVNFIYCFMVSAVLFIFFIVLLLLRIFFCFHSQFGIRPLSRHIPTRMCRNILNENSIKNGMNVYCEGLSKQIKTIVFHKAVLIPASSTVIRVWIVSFLSLDICIYSVFSELN